MIGAALRREESRGVHVRLDFPALDNARWNRHLTFRQGDEA
jgi:L-aspartate oxidase